MVEIKIVRPSLTEQLQGKIVSCLFQSSWPVVRERDSGHYRASYTQNSFTR